MLRHLTVMLMTVFLSVAPVMAQTPTPTPTTSTSGIVRDLSESAERFGAMTVLAFAVIFLLVVAAWRGLAPMLGTIKSLNEARDKLQDELFKRLEAGDEERSRTAKLNERTANILSDLETKQDAQAGRQDAVEAINAHTDTAYEKVRDRLQAIEHKLERVINMLEEEEKKQIQRDETISLTLTTASRELIELRSEVKTLKDTSEPDPLSAPPTPEAP